VPDLRAPRFDELESLRAIERAAGAMFVEAGMPDVAAHEPDSVAALAEYLAGGRAWVVTVDDEPAGYALVDLVDGLAHLEQLSVDPKYGRRGLGTRLVESVCDWARERGLAAVTLTTFEHVSWNAPFYARRGFRAIDDDEIGPELRELREEEAAEGLDPSIRVCMRRDV
jgi:GNAT superfamily N-acetyltransferase